MSIRIKKEPRESFALVTGDINVPPIPVNAYVCGETLAENKITILNPDQTTGNGENVRVLANIPFSEWVKSDDTVPADIDELAADINAQLVAPAPTDINSGYKGVYNGATNTPDLDAIGSYDNGDFFFVSHAGQVGTAGDSVAVNDIVKLSVITDGGGTEISRSWGVIVDQSVKVADIEGSAIGAFDKTVDADYTGAISTGTALQPYKTVLAAVNASSPGDNILVLGDNVIAGEIVLPHSLTFVGEKGAKIRYNSYSASNDSIFSFTGDNTQKFIFKDLFFENAGKYALHIKKTDTVELRSCEFRYNGWDGTQLNTVLASSQTGLLGFDSDAASLQAFYAGVHASNGGAIRIEECTKPLVRECIAEYNLRGFRLQDCGVNGAGFMIENQSRFNIESGFYLAAGVTFGGCQNITVAVNYSAYNANNGLLVIGGINNKFSQNQVTGNWNAGLCNWGSSSLTLRDCGLYDNNRSTFNGIGNTGDAKASIQCNDAFSFIATAITLNPAARFIMEVLDTQVHNTGLGSNTERIGFLMTAGMSAITANEKNIIKIDDVGFIGQDYAIDFGEVDLSNLKVSLGDNSYQNIGQKAVRPPLAGDYFELPYSNHTMRVNSVDFSVNVTGGIVVKEGVGGNVINPYKVNDLFAQAHGTEIRVLLKDSNKVQLQFPVAGCSIDGVSVNSILSEAVGQLNNLFTNTIGFGNGAGGNPVVSQSLNGNNLTTTLQNGDSFTTDLTNITVSTDKFVVSGELVVSDLILTMSDNSTITIDAVNMVNGSTLPVGTDDWFVSYGDEANDKVTSSTLGNFYDDRQPFYYGRKLPKGYEFIWQLGSIDHQRFGVWSGSEEFNDTGTALNTVNWSTCFGFIKSPSGANPRFDPAQCKNVDLSTRHPSGYSMSINDLLALRYGSDNHLELVDITDPDENNHVIIARTLVALTDNEFTLQFAGFIGTVFPNITLRSKLWTIVHDLDNSEDGDITSGIENHTVIRSNMSIEPGEKFMINLDMQGKAFRLGTDYSGAPTGNSNAENDLANIFSYETNEALDFIIGSQEDWNINISSSGYFDNGVGVVGYRVGGANNAQGMFSLRYIPSTFYLEVWSEDNNELVATSKVPLNGSSINLYLGANNGTTTYSFIPAVSKQSIVQPPQPQLQFAPVVADQSFNVSEGTYANIQLVATEYIVNQWVETDAPDWLILNQNTGVFNGNAPDFAGDASDTITINCKAANAAGGLVSFVVTVNIIESNYTNTKSLRFVDGVNSFLSGNPNNVTALQRSGTGAGASDAWSIMMWIKPSSDSSNQSLFYYGGSDVANDGNIHIQQFITSAVSVSYGTTTNYVSKVILSGGSGLVADQWNQILVTYNGQETGDTPSSESDYISRFNIFINGVLPGLGAVTGITGQGGYTGTITPGLFNIGKYDGQRYLDGTILNQMVIWDSDQSGNASGIWNGGELQSFADGAHTGTMDGSYTTPVHYYEFEDSVTSIVDINGNATLTGNGFTSSDLIDDSPST